MSIFTSHSTSAKPLSPDLSQLTAGIRPPKIRASEVCWVTSQSEPQSAGTWLFFLTATPRSGPQQLFFFGGGSGGKEWQLLPNWFSCVQPLPTSKLIFHITGRVLFPKSISLFSFLVLCDSISYSTTCTVPIKTGNSLSSGKLFFLWHFQNQCVKENTHSLSVC